MTVMTIEKDIGTHTMTITAEFDADIDRTWQLWADPRQLERWWGPPFYPATFVDHDLSVGSIVTYYMTGPEGDQPHGWWRITAVDPPNSLEIEDGFADEHGVANPDMPVTHMNVALTRRDGGGTRVAIRSTFASQEAMQQLIAMGMEEGLREAMGQMDAIVAQ